MNKKVDNQDYVLNKSKVIQDSKLFNTSSDNIMIRKCLTQIILLLISKQVTNQEAVLMFYNITKLLNNNNFMVRKLVYLAIKELQIDDVMMVTAILIKDLNTEYKSSAIRLLSKISDIQQIERFIRQIIVDKDAFNSSCALKSCYLKDKRFVNEIIEAANSSNFNQYHAVGLLYLIRVGDRVSVLKMVNTFQSRQPHAICMIIRIAWKLMEDEKRLSNLTSHSLYDVLETFLRNKSDMVVYEAARAICTLCGVTQKELFPAVSALQLLLVNHKTVLRFAAIRTLNTLAMAHPEAVFTCNLDLENLITDANRSISTYAITSLLKTGNEQSVDRLMKQITGFMGEISDDFKVIVVEAVRCLCLKFPAKHMSMLLFLKDILRDEGGYEFKKAIVEAIFDIINTIPESREVALEHLCEFIEDCEHAKLSVRILHVLGAEGPKTSHPTKYIRYIYNRVILENSVVRAAAVSALAKFAEKLDTARERIKVLLERCSKDTDDEVRDRAVLYLRCVNNHELSRKYIANGNTKLIDSGFQWANLEMGLLNYLSNSAAHNVAFDIKSIAVVSSAQEKLDSKRKKDAKSEIVSMIQAQAPEATKVSTVEHSKRILEIPQLQKFGMLLKSSPTALITEPEEEYVIKCTKHLFPNNVVFEFETKNTLEDYILENVNVEMTLKENTDPEEKTLIPQFYLPVSKLGYNETASIYCCFERGKENFPTGTYSVTLKFQGRDCDPKSGVVDDSTYDDEFTPEGVSMYIGDYLISSFCAEYADLWDNLGSESIEAFQLADIKATIEVKEMIESQMGLTIVKVEENVPRGLIQASGKLDGGFILAKIQYVCSPSGVTMQVTVRGDNQGICERLANFVE